MSVFSIADLHLSGSVPKSMEVFGRRWTGYTEKIEKRWRAVVTENDTVIVPGDVSWAMTLAEAEADFRFLASLPGRKLLGKGNHDFWWTTLTKMHRHLDTLGISGIDFLYNNAYRVENVIVCGTRGWFVEEGRQISVSPVDYGKLVAREAIRLELCITEAEKLRTADEEILVYLHFPPVFGSFVCREFVDVLLAHRIRRCFYGHIHGSYLLDPVTEFEGIRFTIISADYLDFTPLFTPQKA
ncbi:MAG: serine/threonine protein phosphatase [Ruminococcaceae bacterium]|nr:serine/threonine protein phosphatase [Oscillospiraceae bacterium]